MNYIISYTLKKVDNEKISTFIDRILILKSEEGYDLQSCIDKYDQLIELSGNLDGYELWNINLSIVTKSSDL